MFQTKVVDKIKTYIFFNSVTIVFRKSCRVWEIVEKCCRARQATDDSMAHAHCYKYTHKFFNTHCFPTATAVAQTPLTVTSYVHRLSCYFSFQQHAYFCFKYIALM